MTTSNQNARQIQQYIVELMIRDADEGGLDFEMGSNGKVNMADMFSGSEVESEMIAAIFLAEELGVMTKSGGFKRRCGITLREFKIKVWGLESQK